MGAAGSTGQLSGEDLNKDFTKFMDVITTLGENCGIKDAKASVKKIFNEQSKDFGNQVVDAIKRYGSVSDGSEPEAKPDQKEVVDSETKEILSKIFTCSSKEGREKIWEQTQRTLMLVVVELGLELEDVPKIKEEIKRFYHMPETVLGVPLKACCDNLRMLTVEQLHELYSDQSRLFQNQQMRELVQYLLLLIITEAE